ncbi:MAG: hypothetical protein FMNOHCHN_00312 [Ignavibacteriaceae bacterium]|nr:hypothetical protein [Ignavibacteriaceae bacterium]
MKRLSDEMPGFLPENLFHKFFLLLLPAELLLSQIPVGGFVRYDRHTVPVGYTSFVTLNYNDDAYTDFLLYGGAGKDMDLVAGFRGNKLKQERKVRPSVKAEYILNFREKGVRGESIFLTSPSMLRSESALITERGNYSLRRSFRHTEYPRTVSSEDINGDGLPDLLLAGINYSGMSIFTAKGNSYEETRLNKGESFEYALFADVNHDGLPDILAWSPFRQSVYILTNNRRGAFRFERSMSTAAGVKGLYAYDINLDGYNDILLLFDDRVTVLYAEPTGAFVRTADVAAGHGAAKMVIGDYNRDGRIDLALLYLPAGKAAAFFQKEDEKFSEPFTLYNESGVTDITNYFSRFIDGIALLDSAGYIHTVTRTGSPGDELTMVSGGLPAVLSTFDMGNNGITDLVWYDRNLSSLRFLMRDGSGRPAVIYTRPVMSVPDKIFVSDDDPRVKSLLLWKHGSRYLELVSADLESFKIARHDLYLDGRIEDVRFVSGEQETEFAVITSRAGTFRYRRFAFRGGKAERLIEIELGSALVHTLIDREGGVYLFKNTGLITTLEFRKLGTAETGVTLFRTEKGKIDPKSFFLIPADEKGNEAVFGLVRKDNEEVFLVRNLRVTSYIDNKRGADAALDALRQESEITLRRRGREVSVWFLTADPRELLNLSFSAADGRSTSRKIRRADDISDFLVRKLTRNRSYLVTASEDGNIRFRGL